jgi:hypothetical protein
VGKAVIVSEQGEGLYTVKKEVRGLAAARALAADRRERLEEELPALRLEEEEAVNAVVYQRFVTDTLLNDWLAGIEIPEDTLNFELRYGITDEARQYVQSQATGLEVPAALMNAIHDLVEKRMLLDDIRRKTDQKSAEYLAVLKWQGELTALQNSADTPIPAWCADYTEDLTGEVATLEVPGEVDPLIGGGINIKPAFSDAAAWNASYGQIQFGKTLSPAGFAWNMTMLTPWLKWMPLWRYATVTAVDKNADTVNVELQPVLSKVGAYLRKDLTINAPWQGKMTGVPVEYMDCNAEVFEVGDEVILQFEPVPESDPPDYAPKCIGFKSDPQECGLYLNYSAEFGLEIIGEAEQRVVRGADGSPVTVQATQSNRFFTQWSDSSTDNPRTDTNVQNNISVVAQGITLNFPNLKLFARTTGGGGFGSGGAYGEESGDLETGRTRIYSGTGCGKSDEEINNEWGWGVPQGTSTVLGDWVLSNSAFEMVDDPTVVLWTYTSPEYTWLNLSTLEETFEGQGISLDFNVTGFWRYQDSNVSYVIEVCNSPGHRFHNAGLRNITGTAFAIFSSDFTNGFWNFITDIGDVPNSVTVRHKASGATAVYVRSHSSGRELFYIRA